MNWKIERDSIPLRFNPLALTVPLYYSRIEGLSMFITN